MSKCAHCDQKRGKRTCPSLDGLICPQCCGKHRGKEIRCSTNCKFVDSSQSYHVGKNEDVFYKHIIEFFEYVYKNYKENGKNFMVFLDTKLYEHMYEKSSLRDSDAITLLDALRRYLSPVELIVHHETGSTRTVWEDADKFINYIGLDNDKALKIVDLYIKQIKDYRGDEKDSNNWAGQFINLMQTKNSEMCEQVKLKKSVDSKIIVNPWGTPGNHEITGHKNVETDNKDTDERKIIIPE